MHVQLLQAIDASPFRRRQLATFAGILPSQFADHLNHGIPRKANATERIGRVAALVGHAGPLFEGDQG